MKVGSMVAWTVVHLAVGLAAGWVVSTAVLLVGQKDASMVACLVVCWAVCWAGSLAALTVVMKAVGKDASMAAH